MRTGLIAGAAVGYYLGAKAGRQRYEQLSKVVHRAARSGAMRSGVGKIRAAAELGVERVRDLLENGEEPDLFPVGGASELRGSARRSRAISADPGKVVYLSAPRDAPQRERRYF